MNNPDFSQMTRKELKKFILANPTNDDAIRELFLKRKLPTAKIYPAPSNIYDQELEAIFKAQIKSE